VNLNHIIQYFNLTWRLMMIYIGDYKSASNDDAKVYLDGNGKFQIVFFLLWICHFKFCFVNCDFALCLHLST
jgi:hypothetical protein